MALEQRLQVGDFIYGFKFTQAPGGGPPGMVSSGVVDGSLKVKRLRETVVKRLILKDRVEVTVTHDQVDFRWLPWVPGKINYANHEGKDVLSGMFTGCWMAVYTESNVRVAHIATQTDDTDCKAAWRTQRALSTVSQVEEFLPHTGLGVTNLGLVTAAKSLYKIELADAQVTIANPWSTVADWMDPTKGNKSKEFAEIFVKHKEVGVGTIYGFGGYRIVKIVGPVAPETFPA